MAERQRVVLLAGALDSWASLGMTESGGRE